MKLYILAALLPCTVQAQSVTTEAVSSCGGIEVSASGTVWDSSTLTITEGVGTTALCFTGVASPFHNVRITNYPAGYSGGKGTTIETSPGAGIIKAVITDPTPGDIQFDCTKHPRMTMTVTVTAVTCAAGRYKDASVCTDCPSGKGSLPRSFFLG